MKTPVIIAARNEEAFIGQTLASLDPYTVEPYVIVNDSYDATAQIARDTGAHVRVFESEQPGKVPSIQLGLRMLGDRALEPVLYLDADTTPLYPRHWAATMIKGLGKQAHVGSGLFIASDGPRAQRYAMTTLRIANQLNKVLTGTPLVSGANMVTRIDDEDRLEALLAVDNFWAGEDVARAEAVAGDGKIKSILAPGAIVKTSSRYMGSPLKLLMKGRSGALEAVQDNRLSRSSAGTISYPIAADSTSKHTA